MDVFTPGFRFMLIGLAGFGSMLVIGALFYVGIVVPLIRAAMYTALWDIGQPEQADILSLRRAIGINPRYVVRYRYRLLQNDGTLKTVTHSEKVNRQIFIALSELHQQHQPAPIRYLAEKPGVALLEMTMEHHAAERAALGSARSRRRRNPVRSFVLIVVFVIISVLLHSFGSTINQFLDSLVS